MADASSSNPLDGSGCFEIRDGPLQGVSGLTVPVTTYDVFINHRGPDVKKTLVSHLYATLKTVNFSCFVDYKGIQVGDSAKCVMKSAIQHSKVQIAIFSPGYAESEWCLDELFFIMESFRRNSTELFLPVFFNVTPSDLRVLTPSRKSCYNSSFEKHSQKIEATAINKWKKALHEAADVKGFIFPDDFQGFEARLVEGIVSKIIEVLSRSTLLHGPKHPVGVDEKLQDALYHMRIGGWSGSNVQKFGIYGMGGMGKTTLATSIYNRTHREFESACFIPSVSESCRFKGLVGLQQDLLHKLLKTREIFIFDTACGKQLMREQLKGRKVLIILDDVSEKKQLDELMPPYDCCLGKGSQIVITTRDQRILKWAEAKKSFPIEGLSRDLSLQLFKMHAFPSGGKSPPYAEQPKIMTTSAGVAIDLAKKDLAEKVAAFCQGLPLALEVLGSYLKDEDISIWKATVKLLERNKMGDPLQSGVTAILKISFDALGSAEKEMFLDIACFMLQECTDTALRVWRSDYGEEEVELQLENLIHKCLVKVDENGDLTIHDLLRDMGRQIVHNSHKDYWKRSHLWREEEVESILKKRKGKLMSRVRGLSSSVEREWHTSSFSDMDELRLLLLNRVTLTGDFSEICHKLRCLQLRNCSLIQIPSLHHLVKLAVLDLWGSQLTSFSCGDYMLQNLRELNLRDCSNLVELLIDFSRSCKSLEVLLLSGCVNLERLPDSIGELSSSLTYLDVSGCRKLTTLPEGIGNLTALGKIGLHDMVNLVSLPRSISLLAKLEVLNLEGCSNLCEIRALPSSLTSLAVGGCTGLKHLDTSGCSNLGALPDGLKSLCQLSHLDLGGHKSLICGKRSLALATLTSLKTLSLAPFPSIFRMRDDGIERSQRMFSLKQVAEVPSGDQWSQNDVEAEKDICSTSEVEGPASFNIHQCSGASCGVGGIWDGWLLGPGSVGGAQEQHRAAVEVEVTVGGQKFHRQLTCSQIWTMLLHIGLKGFRSELTRPRSPITRPRSPITGPRDWRTRPREWSWRGR